MPDAVFVAKSCLRLSCPLEDQISRLGTLNKVLRKNGENNTSTIPLSLKEEN